MKLYALKLPMNLNDGLPTYPPLGKSVKHFVVTLLNKGLALGMNLQPYGKHLGVYLIMGTTQQHQNPYLILSKSSFFQPKSGTLSIS